MGDEEIRAKRSKQRRRNIHAKIMHETLRPKIFDPRKQEYKRLKSRDLMKEVGNENEYETREDS